MDKIDSHPLGRNDPSPPLPPPPENGKVTLNTIQKIGAVPKTLKSPSASALSLGRYTPNEVLIPSGREYPDYSMLLLGGPGTGKTTMALTAERPIHVLDLDRKLDQLAGLVDMRGVTYQQFDRTLQGGNRIRVAQSPSPDSLKDGYDDSINPRVYNQVVETVNSLYDIADREGKLPFRTLVLDTMSRLSEHLQFYQLKLHKHAYMSQRDWGVFYINIAAFVNGLLGLPCNVIVCCHDTIWEDDATHEVNVSPAVPGKMSGQLAGFFAEVYYLLPKITAGKMSVDVLTHADRKYKVRSTMTDLIQVPADIGRIVRGDFRGQKAVLFQEEQKKLKLTSKGGKVTPKAEQDSLQTQDEIPDETPNEVTNSVEQNRR